MMIPPRTVSCSSTLLIKTRSCKGRTFMVCSPFPFCFNNITKVCWHSNELSANSREPSPILSIGLTARRSGLDKLRAVRRICDLKGGEINQLCDLLQLRIVDLFRRVSRRLIVGLQASKEKQ